MDVSGVLGVQEALALVAAAVVGFVVGSFFFGTLWYTVRRLRSSAHPHLLLFGSFVLRAGAVLAVFYWLASRGVWAIVPAAVGFLLARFLLVRRLGPLRSTERAS